MPRSQHNDPRVHGQIARRVRKARHDKGWTQEQLAEALDVATETISRYESGRRALSVAMIHRIADALGVPGEELLGKRPAGLTRAETELVEAWRLLAAEEQRVVMELLRLLNRDGYQPRREARSGGLRTQRHQEAQE